MRNSSATSSAPRLASVGDALLAVAPRLASVRALWSLAGALLWPCSCGRAACWLARKLSGGGHST
eukprot:3701337-Alexandrium_andersonii.AAC.1